jgi:hypothetical protein
MIGRRVRRSAELGHAALQSAQFVGLYPARQASRQVIQYAIALDVIEFAVHQR